MRHARGGEVLLSDAERGDVTDLFAETCGDDGTDCGGPGEGFAMHRFAGWIEERVAEAERKAADHDAFGVEEIDEDGDGLAEFLADDANDGDAGADRRLEEGLEETFPASDAVSAKDIT